MEDPNVSAYSWLDFFFSLLGVCTFLFDVGSDLWIAIKFYEYGDYFWFGLLLGFLLTSSVLVQMFSWFWLQYDQKLENFERQTSDKKVILFGNPGHPKLTCFLHVCQLGFILRHISALRQGFCVVWLGEQRLDYAVYLTHDLSMLRLIETFSESAPQLTLMVYVMLRTNRARTVQYVSAIASTTSIAWMVVDYHRSLRFFLPDKSKQSWSSSVVYFLWNLLLIGPRLVTVALFASVLPCYIAIHFFALWIVFFLWAYLQSTNFMDSPAGEWLYRATVGLIWYFSWFNVMEGRTRDRSIIYHFFILIDSGILLFTWWLLRDPEVTQSYVIILLILLPASYVVGLLVKVLYYYRFHPNQACPGKHLGDVPDAGVPLKMTVESDGGSVMVVNKRMAKHAANFYSPGTNGHQFENS